MQLISDILLLLSLGWTVLASSPFILEGSNSSYAQFRKWNAALNGTLAFEFRTEQRNGLLLYTDDGGFLEFFEVKLVEGALRLHYNLGAGAQFTTAGRNLNDSRWHKAEIRRNIEQTSLIVDHVTVTRTSRGKEFAFGNLSTNSFVFIGGLPSMYESRMKQLALPSVIFEPRYGGAIRNLIFADNNGPPRQQQMMASKGVRVNQHDVCNQQDPCRHGGICINTDLGPVCECRNIDYEGPYCEKEKPPSEATLRGQEYFFHDLAQTGGEPIVSNNDEISLYFKTRQSTGILFYTGDGEDYLALTLRDGAVSLNINLGGGKLDVRISPRKVRFDDNQWHKIHVQRATQEISGQKSVCRLVMTVDGIHTERWNTAGTFTMLSSSRLYVGGIDRSVTLPGLKIRNGFMGCLRKVEFTADSKKLDILQLARTGNKFLTVSGSPEWMCQAIEGSADPITFTTPDTIMILPFWDAPRTGSISFKIRTNEANGLLFYNNGAAHSQGDYFAIELLNGIVILHLDLGSGGVKVNATARRVDDGIWHEVLVYRNGKSGRVSVDGASTDFVTPGDSHQLELEGSLLVGGIGSVVDNAAIPPSLWSATLRHGYVGCMRDLIINGEAVDLAAYAREQDSGAIRPACHVLPPQCESQPCMNGGLCTEGWNRFVCDCTATAFNGPTCGKDAATLNFDGTQHFRVLLNSPSRTEAEDWRLRFRTAKSSGLIFTTVADGINYGRAELAISGGQLRFSLLSTDRPKSWFLGQGLSDNQWHRVSISRRGSSIRLTIDDENPLQDEISGRTVLLETRTLHFGSTTKREDIYLTSAPLPNFVGQIQQLSFNGIYLIDLARYGQLNSASITAKFGKKEQSIHHPINFKSKNTYVGLPQLKAYSTVNMHFQFKTLEPRGIILYNAGKGQDFIAVELHDGHIQYVVNLGDGPIRIRDSYHGSLNDNRWHSVTIGRPTPKQHTLMVDDFISTVPNAGSNENLDLSGILYLGGVSKDMYSTLPRQVQSRHGFEGCLASLDLNGESPDTTLEALVPSSLVVPGCEDSVAFEFGVGHGLILYNYPKDRRPDTKSDVLTFGFITLQENGLLVRCTSASSNDYLDIELIDGKLFALYNMGTEDHRLGELGVKVNDGEHHVIRFLRSGANATLQVDDYNVQTKVPSGKQLFTFNSQSQIHVGGKWNEEKSKVERPFVGIMAGLVFNGIRILDLATERDPRVQVRGNVELLTSIPVDYKQRFGEHSHHSMQRVQASVVPESTDDIIFPPEGSGCPPSTVDDECVPVYNRGGDDLITPVYIAPTRPPKPKPPSIIVEYNKQCDDEDCFDGSGGGRPLTEDPVNPSEDGVTTEISTVTHVPSSVVTLSSATTSSTTSSMAVQTSTLSTRTTTSSTSIVRMSPFYSTRYPFPAVHMTPRPRSTRKPTVKDIWDGVWELTTVKDPNHLQPETNRGRISSEAAENTAMIIGIVAGALIAVILVVLLVLKFKGRNPSVYKVEESKSFGKLPSHSTSNAALLNFNAAASASGKAAPPTPGLTTLEKKTPPSKKNGKDIKEWYV